MLATPLRSAQSATALTCAVTEFGNCAKSLAAQKSTNDASPSKDKLREVVVAYSAGENAMEFPASPDFNSRPPRLDPTAFVAWCEEMMSQFDAKRDDAEQPFALKARESFVL